jgi:hypothetical protein
MAFRFSDGLRNALAKDLSYGNAMQDGVLVFYTGTQPASANAAATGTPLVKYTSASLTHTPEVLATGTVVLATGAVGSVDTITVNGVNILGAPVPFNATLAQTAADVATQINKSVSATDYKASAVGTTVTISAAKGAGATPNGFVVTGTSTTLTMTFGNMAGGVSPINGLKFALTALGVVNKDPAQVWSGIGLTTGVAGWFRFYSSVADAGSLDAAGAFIRADGAIAASGAEINSPQTMITAGVVSYINDFPVSVLTN